MWKLGKIIPVPKPGKSPSQGSSYRPITLVSPVVKVLEALMLPTLKEHLPMADHQHGFRAGRSTTTALCELTTAIADGLNGKRPHERTILVALDLSKAFDTVCHTTLLRDILESDLPPLHTRWLSNYMAGRQSYVEFRDARSRLRKNKLGVPQGGVLSPLLFNYYISKLPSPPPGVKLVSYADDCTILATGRSITDLEARINGYLPILKSFFVDRNLQLSAPKSTATLFTTWTKEVSLELNINISGQTIPTTKNPKVLGVTFDNLFSFSKHVGNVTQKVKERNKILRALTGSTWGKNKETILATYKAIGRSLIDYASPAWSPCISDTQWKNLQTVQNTALRIVTGCHAITPEDHLHQETKVLPVKNHCTLLTRQLLIKCERPDHPNHIGTRPFSTGRPRPVRSDIRRERNPVSHLANLVLDGKVKVALNSLHTDAVYDAIEHFKPTLVLGGRPPPTHASESMLTRPERTSHNSDLGTPNTLTHILPVLMVTCP